jgi:hypothetical protein
MPSLFRRGRFCLLSTLFALALLGGTSEVARAQDRVTFLSGNFLDGEIKQFQRGTLDFDTEEMDVVGVDWDDVESISSEALFEVTTDDGDVYYGSLGGTGRTLVVTGEAGATNLSYDDIVEIISISSGFVARTSGFVDMGVNLTRANNLFSFLLRARAAYSGPKWFASVQGEQYSQSQETTDDLGNIFKQETRRTSVNLTGKRIIGGKFAVTLAEQIEQNDELNLDRRVLTTLGGQYFAIRNQSVEMSFGAGAVLNSEQYVGEERTESGEVNVSAGFDAFDIGDLNVYAAVNSYTNPADGRVRVDIDGRVSWELFSDFFIGFNLIEKFDTAPPATAPDRDFQYGLTVGWSWS